jgi:mRNA interferase RelE/StbE
MPRYEIVFARSARKELQSLSPTLVERILGKIEILASNPRPSGYKKLRGHSSLWRIRVGEYRVIYSIDDNNLVVDISVVRHRSLSLNTVSLSPSLTINVK